MSDEVALITVGIFAGNRLSGGYLLKSLVEDKRIRAHLLSEAEEAGREPENMFVIDLCSTIVPVRECVKILLSRSPTARFVAVDITQSAQDIAHLLRIGIHGFVADTEVELALQHAVTKVAHGSLWFSRDVFECVANEHCLNSDVRPLSVMTAREIEVLRLLKRRLSNREIGSLLNINKSTVKYHVSNIFSKLQIASRRDLASSHTTRQWQQFRQQRH